MPLQDDQKSSAPLKRADIKTLLLAASNRKRKASSPIPPPTEAKNLKTCDKENDEDIQVLDVSVNSDITTSDFKENQDVNTLQTEQIPSCNGDNVNSDNDMKSLESDQHLSSEEDSLKPSSDDVNTSLLNSSLNVLNTSGLSEANQDAVEKNASANTATNSKPENNNGQEKQTNTKKRKRMTPEEAKQKAEEREKKKEERLHKKQELEARKLERERELQQRKHQKEIEKKAKEEERKEKERLRLEKKEQEEKEKQLKQEEKEEQKRIRQMMLETKLEKKKQMEEMKLKQAEERKKAEEEKKKAELEKQQKEREKKEKAKAAFVKFFRKENISPPSSIQKTVEQDSIFKPFQISEDMTLAPVIPIVSKERFNQKIFDTAVNPQNDTNLYLHILKSGTYTDIRNRKKLRKPKLCEADVLIVETEQLQLNLKAKLIQFSENVRPPYWGTWRKKSKAIRPRNPFGQDEIFDYDVDSDDEWDEGGPGESLSGTEQEDESGDDDNDNYEENEFLVPHGYLSAEEEKEDDDEVQVDNDPENRKKLLKKKLQEFEMERKKKTTELKPIILGCYIENGPSKSENSQLLAALELYSAVLLTDTPIPTSFTVKIQNDSKPNSTASSPNATSNILKSKSVPEAAMPYLIRFVHGNHHSFAFLIAEFLKFWQQHCLSQEQTEKLASENPEIKVEGNNSTAIDTSSVDTKISKRQLTLTLKQIATKRSVDTVKKMVWYVNDEFREKHGLQDLSIINTWTHLETDVKDDADASPITKPSNSKFSIKEFLA